MTTIVYHPMSDAERTLSHQGITVLLRREPPCPLTGGSGFSQPSESVSGGPSAAVER